MFRRGAQPPVKLLIGCTAVAPLLLLLFAAFGATGLYRDAKGTVEHVFIAQVCCFFALTAAHLDEGPDGEGAGLQAGHCSGSSACSTVCSSASRPQLL